MHRTNSRRQLRASPRPRPFWRIVLVVLILALAPLGSRPIAANGPASAELSTYVRVGRFNLPEPTRTASPPNSLLAEEASSVTYNWDTDSLFVVGDGGTSVVQVSKAGALINSMTLAPGGSPQGTEFYDTEGITYVGGGQFVLVEERDRQVSLFTYIAGGTLHRTDVHTVKVGTTIGNIGLEGLSFDPLTGGLVIVKDSADQSTSRPLVGLAQAYWIAGDETAARAVFGELTAGDTKRYLSPCDVAEVLSVFGDRQGCIKFLRKAVDEGCGDLAGLRMDPMYDAVRATDEFKLIESLVFGDV